MTRKKPDRRSDKLRYALAHETAKIITVEGVRDFHRAKLKASERLGNSQHGSLPSNFEIEQALSSFQKTFIPDYEQVLLVERQIALTIMQWLQNYSPFLVGSISGCAVGVNAPISIHISCETVESVVEVLEDKSMQLNSVERRLKLNNEFVLLPTINFEYKNFEIDVVVFNQRQQHQQPKSKIQNRSMPRINIKALKELLEIN
ncbi:MAG: hypothetical protein ACRBDX_07340 [Gammaproteobacteria bacterium]